MRYNAFISYKHAENDIFVAKQVHKRLETFKIPRAVKKSTGKKKIERVFRDVEELPIGSDLGNNISTALEESEYLIVICSKETPKSYWVNQEIETFIKLKGHSKILAVLVDGEPDEAFPPKLLTDDSGKPIEPLAADVRGKTKKEINKKMKTEIVRLAAQVIGCSYDELKQRHRERRMRKILTASVAIAVLAISFGFYSVYNYLTIKKNYEAKLINQSKYLADTSVTLLEHGDRMTAGLIALEALPSANNKRPLVSSAQLALSKALYAYADGNDMVKDRLLKHDLQVEDIKYSADGSKMVSLDIGGTAYVWDIEDGSLLLKVSPWEEILGTMLTTDDNLIMVGMNSIKCFNLNGEVIWSANTDVKYIGCVFDTTNDKIAVISSDLVEVWDAINGEIIADYVNNDDDYAFSDEGVFDSEGENFVFACYPDIEDAKEGKVCTLSLSDSKIKTITTAASYIMRLCYTENGDVLVMSRNDLENASEVTYMNVSLEKFNASTQKRMWDKNIEISLQEIYMSNVILKSRKYSDGNIDHDEVIVSFKNTVNVYDNKNGDFISKITVPQGVATLLYSTQSSIGYIVDDNCVLNFYDLSTGELASANGINIDRSATQVIISNGVLAAKIYASPDVLIMKYYEGYGKESIAEYEDTVYELEYSENEEIYVVIGGNSLDTIILSFYDAKNDELILQYESEELYYASEFCFIGDDYYCALLSDGVVMVLDIKDESVDSFVIDNNENFYDWSLSSNNKYAVAYLGMNYAVVDIENQKVIDNGTVSSGIITSEPSCDGSTVYFVCEENVVKVNTNDSKQTELSVSDFSNISLSSDGKFLAGICNDNKIRVYETGKYELVNEFDFISHGNGVIEFIPEEYKFITQGDTYYWGVYDVEAGEYVYLSDDQCNDIEKIISNKDTVAIYTDVNMIIINKKDYEPIADVLHGIGYLPETGVVFTENGNILCKFPYMDLEMLLEQAKKEFGNYSLSKLERIQYNID